MLNELAQKPAQQKRWEGGIIAEEKEHCSTSIAYKNQQEAPETSKQPNRK
jgi:hypothetical protein